MGQNTFLDPRNCQYNNIKVTPADIAAEFAKIAHRQDRFASAILGLKREERTIVLAYLNKIDFPAIGRMHGVSYKQTLVVIGRCLVTMRKVIAAQDRNKQVNHFRASLLSKHTNTEARCAPSRRHFVSVKGFGDLNTRNKTKRQSA